MLFDCSVNSRDFPLAAALIDNASGGHVFLAWEKRQSQLDYKIVPTVIAAPLMSQSLVWEANLVPASSRRERPGNFPPDRT